jgi:hypothetical protein
MPPHNRTMQPRPAPGRRGPLSSSPRDAAVKRVVGTVPANGVSVGITGSPQTGTARGRRLSWRPLSFKNARQFTRNYLTLRQGNSGNDAGCQRALTSGIKWILWNFPRLSWGKRWQLSASPSKILGETLNAKKPLVGQPQTSASRLIGRRRTGKNAWYAN